MQIKRKSGTGRTGMTTAAALPLSEIRPARVNVHAAERRASAEFAGLVESIRANGLIHRIVVRRSEAGDGWVIVDGHRRFEAAKAAGLVEVPVEIRDVGEDAAIALTVAANVQRLENDPILEAEAVERMLKSGMSRSEVAAAIGKDEGYVARRARLINLTPAWRDFAKRVPCTVVLLERVASHESGLQERVAVWVGLPEYVYSAEDLGPCKWSEFDSVFSMMKMRIADAAFDTAVCANCPNNTECHEYLFDFMADEGRGEGAQCQDPACYVRRNNEAVDAKIAELKRKGNPAIEVADKWRIPEYWDASENESRKHPKAYVFSDGNVRRMMWSVPPPEDSRPAKAAMTAAEREAAKAEKRRTKAVLDARNAVRESWRMLVRGGCESVRNRLGAASYDELSARCLAREIGRGWWSDEFVDDYARVAFETATAGMEQYERDAYEAELVKADEDMEEAATGE